MFLIKSKILLRGFPDLLSIIVVRSYHLLRTYLLSAPRTITHLERRTDEETGDHIYSC
jgi:hypothetical protein